MPPAIRSFFAPCSPGLEELLEADVRAAGAEPIRARGGVAFSGPPAAGYHVALWSRVAIRVLERLTAGQVRSPDDVYRLAYRFPWTEVLSPGQTISVTATASGQAVTNEQFASLRVKDGVVDHLRQHTGGRPDVDRDDADLPLRLVVRGSEAKLYRDLGGDSLHRRGYRPIQVKSPLNEAVAAGLILLSGWDGRAPLVDPMCGSGTLLIEAAWIAGDRAPNLGRDFPFLRWPDLDRTAWHALNNDARARWEKGRANLPSLQGNARHPGAIGIAEDAAARAGVGRAIRFTNQDVTDFVPNPAAGMVVVNPPWGVRIGEGEDLERSWRELGAFLKHQCVGATAWVLSGDAELTRAMHLRATAKHPVRNGPVDCRWLRYEMRGPTMT